jgi:hypothetical protein
MGSRGALALLAALTLAACGGKHAQVSVSPSPSPSAAATPAAAAASPAATPAGPVLDCVHRIDPVGPKGEPGGSVVAGPVTFSGLRGAAGAEFAAGGPAQRYKAGLSVTRGAPVTVTVAAADRDWLALEYGAFRNDGPPLSLRDGHAELRFTPCAAGAKRYDGRPVGRVTSWAGGFLVLRPGCATLRVQRAGAAATSVRVGFGGSC